MGYDFEMSNYQQKRTNFPPLKHFLSLLLGGGGGGKLVRYAKIASFHL